MLSWVLHRLRRTALLFQKLGVWHVFCTLLTMVVVLCPILLPFVLPPLDYPHLHLSSYVMNICMVISVLHTDGVSSLLLMTAYFMFDYERFKWRERRRFDLSTRLRRRVPLSTMHSPPLYSPEGAFEPSWESLPSPTFTPMDVSTICSRLFNEICQHTPDFVDILTLDLIPSCPDTFCGLLDDSSVGIYMFDQTPNIVVFDTGASVCISNDPNDFVSWDTNANVSALQGITSRAPVKGSGIVSWSLLDDHGVSHDITTHAYFVPDAKVRLFSPQRFLRDRDRGSLVLTPNSTIYYFDQSSPLTFHALNQRHVGLPLASLHRRRSLLGLMQLSSATFSSLLMTTLLWPKRSS